MAYETEIEKFMPWVEAGRGGESLLSIEETVSSTYPIISDGEVVVDR